MRFAVHFNEHSRRSVQLCLKSYRMLSLSLALALALILCLWRNETKEKKMSTLISLDVSYFFDLLFPLC